jgi:hypothetical protein
MHPIESQADIAAALPPSLLQFERFADYGHGAVPDRRTDDRANLGIRPEALD